MPRWPRGLGEFRWCNAGLRHFAGQTDGRSTTAKREYCRREGRLYCLYALDFGEELDELGIVSYRIVVRQERFDEWHDETRFRQS